MRPPCLTPIQCGDALPVVTGRLASMRRRWVARIGWYPGDWMWLALATLVVRPRAQSSPSPCPSTGRARIGRSRQLERPCPYASPRGRSRRARPRRRRATPRTSRRRPSRARWHPGAAGRCGPRTRPAGRSSSSRIRKPRPSSGAVNGDEGGQGRAHPGRRGRLEPLREPPARVLRRLHRHLPLAGGRRRRRRNCPAGGIPGRVLREIAR